MAKDTRLYARFDIGMDENAKIAKLSDAAFRALFEATLYSRRQLTDGFLDEFIALKRWGADAIAELTSNHAERPSWVKVDGGWQIRDYAEHQTTRADIEAKQVAGRAGGIAKASRTVAPATEVLEQKASTTLAKTETETETTTTDVVVPRKRGTRIPEPFMVTRDMRAWAATHTPDVAVDRSTMKFANYWRAKSGRDATKLDWVSTWQNWLLNDADRSTAKPSPEARARATVTLATELIPDLKGVDA